MNFRKSTQEDFPEIMRLINMAKEYFKSLNSNQWQNINVIQKKILVDISKGFSYLIQIDGKAVATFALIQGDEFCIFNHLKWLKPNSKYITIHRVSVDNSIKRRGLGTQIMKQAQRICREKNIESLRVDTRIENIEMQALIKKSGFTHLGIIFLTEEKKYDIFQKVIELELKDENVSN